MTVREIALLMTMLAIAVAGGALYWKSKSHSQGRRISLQIFGVLLILISSSLTFIWWAKTRSRMPAPVFSTESPGGQFIARVVEPDGDLLPTNLVRVSVRSKGNFFARQIYAGPDEPILKWLDDKTLQFTFPATNNPVTCGGNGSEPRVICNAVPLNQFKPHLRM